MRGWTEADHQVLADRRVAQQYDLASRRDAGSDGLFVVSKPMSGIFCRLGCALPLERPSKTTFYPTPAAASAEGLRPCPRCRPEMAPRHPDLVYGDSLGARACRLIDDGEIDRGGVPAVAHKLGITPRHVQRAVRAAVGCGPLELARFNRAQLARLLLSSTTVPMSVVAVAAGFATVRQFNVTVKEIYGSTPSELRFGNGQRGGVDRERGPLVLRCTLSARVPIDLRGILRQLAARAIPEVEQATDTWYSRVVRLPHGVGHLRVDTGERGRLLARFSVGDPRDLRPLYHRTRLLFDLDALPGRIGRILAVDPLLEPLVKATAGIRVPSGVEPFESVLRAVVDDALPPPSARTVLGGLANALGDPTPWGIAFPTAQRIAREGRTVLRGDRQLIDAIMTLAQAVAEGRWHPHTGMAHEQLVRDLGAVAGVGTASADLAAVRVLAARDLIRPADDDIREGARRSGLPAEPAALRWHSERWAPVRSYAAALLRGAADEA